MTYDFSGLDDRVTAKGGRAKKSAAAEVDTSSYETVGEPTVAFNSVETFESIKFGDTVLTPGDALKFTSQKNKKFTFKSYSRNPKTATDWVSVSDASGMNRSFKVSDIKQVN